MTQIPLSTNLVLINTKWVLQYSSSGTAYNCARVLFNIGIPVGFSSTLKMGGNSDMQVLPVLVNML